MTRFPLCCYWICNEVVQITDRVVFSITRWTAGTHGCISCYLSYRKKNKPCQQTSTSPREESSKTEERSHYVHQKAQYQSHFLATHIYLHTPWSPHLIPTKPGLEQHNDAEERQDIPKTCSWSPITQALQRKSTTTSQKLVGCLLSVQAINLLIQNQCVIEVQNASKALRLWKAKLNSTALVPIIILLTCT